MRLYIVHMDLIDPNETEISEKKNIYIINKA